MRRLAVAALLMAASAHAQGQASPRGKPLGAWDVEYDRAILHMHGETTQRHERGQMTLRADGDSLFGDLVIGDSATATRSVLRGTSSKSVWTLYVEDPAPKGVGLFFSALGVAMDWLRETVHGIQPTVTRLDLTARGDSVTGSRTVTGGMSSSPRVSTIAGRRIKS